MTISVPFYVALFYTFCQFFVLKFAVIVIQNVLHQYYNIFTTKKLLLNNKRIGEIKPCLF